VALVLRAAWNHLENPEVLERFAEAVACRLAEHLAVPGLKRAEVDTIPDEKRHRVCEAIVPHWLERGKNPVALAYTETPLLMGRDLPWLIERVRTAASPAHQGFWVAVVRAVFWPEYPGHVDALLEAMPRCPALETAFGPLFAPVELHSVQAETMRAEYRRWQEWQEGPMRSRKPLEPPPQERVAILLNRLKDKSLEDAENLPDPDELAEEIADDLATALQQFRTIASDLKGYANRANRLQEAFTKPVPSGAGIFIRKGQHFT
jgi:hypothetical protein